MIRITALQGANRRDGLASLVAALEVLEATSNLVSAVPFFSGIVSGALGLARSLEVCTFRFVPAQIVRADFDGISPSESASRRSVVTESVTSVLHDGWESSRFT